MYKSLTVNSWDMQNYLSKLKELDDKTVRVLASKLNYELRILGTDVTVTRQDKDSVNRKAYGAMYQTSNPLASKKKTFTQRFIINRQNFVDAYTKASNPLNIYHNKAVLQKGDTITFKDGKINYSFKVVSVMEFGLKPALVVKYELIGLKEESDGNI